jgi:hypothetical protein
MITTREARDRITRVAQERSIWLAVATYSAALALLVGAL